MFASRNETYPNSTNYDKVSEHDMIKYKSSNTTNMSGLYYVTVYGIEYSEFTIYAAIGRATEVGVGELDFITLAPGTP